MAVVLKKYEPAEGVLTELGTVKQIAGKGGSLKFDKKNFNSNKRVVVIVKDKKGDSGVIACSSQVSNYLRKMKASGTANPELLGWVAGLQVLENEQGVNFISMPAGTGSEEYNVDSLKVVITEDFLPQEMIAF